ncbi:hypothetical protein GcC1_008023, partial [Golovinomyces cichoracearum]
RVLKKTLKSPSKWPECLPQAVFEVNNREITHLHYSPANIFLGFEPIGAVGVHFASFQRQSLSGAILLNGDISLTDENQAKSTGAF